jgi:hypothetical protein
MASALRGGGVSRMEPGVRIHSVPLVTAYSKMADQVNREPPVSSCILWAHRSRAGTAGDLHIGRTGSGS